MYRAKREGRNAYLFHTPEMSAQCRRSPLHRGGAAPGAGAARSWCCTISRPWKRKTGRIVGMEALLRWNSPGGLVRPRELIPVAEETGLIVDIGHWVLECACTQAAQWQSAGVGAAVVEDQRLCTAVHGARSVSEHRDRALGAAGFRASLLALEITESMLIDQTSDVSEVLAQAGAARGTARDRRFRHGLFELDLSEALSAARHQDRPVLRARDHLRSR